MARVLRFPDGATVIAAAAERITACLEEAIDLQRSATICLTGGATAGRLYTLLADPARAWRDRIDWGRVHVFWGDERHVPPDHPDSNYGMASRTLLAHVAVPASQIHRIRAEHPDPAAAARAYEAAVRAGFERAHRPDETFDLVLLGLGADGHIASLFPGSAHPGSDDASKSARVAAVWAAHLQAWRITLSPAALLAARRIVMVVSGQEKAEAVHAAFDLPTDVMSWPVHLLRQAGDRVEWFIDAAAAARSRGATPS